MGVQYKILIVEDDPDFSGFLEKLLSLKGYDVLVAGNGSGAVGYLNEYEIDLAILDMQLPDMNGYEVLDCLKVQLSDTPVIMMTGYASIDSAVKALRKGAYDYLEKPFAIEKLLNTIQNALEHKRLETQGKKALEKLGESEEKYHRLFDSVTDALMIFDAESRIFEDANAATLDLFGYSLEEFCNLQVEEISAEKDKTMNAVQRVKEGEQGSQFVPLRYLRKKDGTVFPGEISAAVFASGGRQKIIGSIRDISERQRTMEELNSTKKRLQHLLSSSPSIIYSVDPNSDFAATFVSDNVKTVLGYEPQEYIDDPNFWVDRIHPDDARNMKSWISNLMESGRQASEYRFRHKDGSYHWLHDELRMIYDAQGAPVEVVGNSIDITARVKAENQLRESEERFRHLVEDSLIGIAIIQDDKFVYQNRVLDKLYGPIPAKPFLEALEYFHPDDAEKVKIAYNSMVSGRAQTAETDFRIYPSGRIGHTPDMIWIQFRATPFNYRGRKALLINAIDITEAKKLEQQLIIKNKMLSLGRVAAGIAHEIRNPLTGINSYLFTLADLCRMEQFESEDIEMMQQIVDQIQVASNKIESVIKRVMDFSKPGAPKMVLTDINESLEEALKLSAVTIRKKGIKLEKALGNNLPHCYADPQLIEQVILNLITNAANAMENGTSQKMIEVKSYSKNNMLCIGVSDSGPGVPLKLREKIFDPFFTTREDGQGIGLNISQRIVADHYGSLSLDTSKWGGAEFRIELPVEKRVNPR